MDAPPVQYVTTPDGVRLAYSVTGRGEPCVVVPAGWNHIQLMWRVAAVRPWLIGLAERFMLVQFDGRGQGLSTRGLPETYSQYDRVADIEVVVDQLKLEPAVLFAVGSAGHAAIRFAARRPDRVRGLILMNCSVTSEPWPRALMQGLAGADWETFLSMMATSRKAIEEPRTTVEFLRQMVTQSDFETMARTWTESSVREDLKSVQAPALVLHLVDVDRRPTLQDSSELAASFAEGRLVEISGAVAPWMVGSFDAAITHIEAFLESLTAPGGAPSRAEPPGSLSSREVEVLRLLAAGKSNAQIAEELVISQNTVIRHVSHIFAKIGAENRTEAASYAHRHGLT